MGLISGVWVARTLQIRIAGIVKDRLLEENTDDGEDPNGGEPTFWDLWFEVLSEDPKERPTPSKRLIEDHDGEDEHFDLKDHCSRLTARAWCLKVIELEWHYGKHACKSYTWKQFISLTLSKFPNFFAQAASCRFLGTNLTDELMASSSHLGISVNSFCHEQGAFSCSSPIPAAVRHHQRYGNNYWYNGDLLSGIFDNRWFRDELGDDGHDHSQTLHRKLFLKLHKEVCIANRRMSLNDAQLCQTRGCRKVLGLLMLSLQQKPKFFDADIKHLLGGTEAKDFLSPASLCFRFL